MSLIDPISLIGPVCPIGLIGPIGIISLLCPGGGVSDLAPPLCHREEAVGGSAPIPVFDGLLGFAQEDVFPVAAVRGRRTCAVSLPFHGIAREHRLVATIHIIRRVFIALVSACHILISPYHEARGLLTQRCTRTRHRGISASRHQLRLFLVAAEGDGRLRHLLHLRHRYHHLRHLLLLLRRTSGEEH